MVAIFNTKIKKVYNSSNLLKNNTNELTKNINVDINTFDDIDNNIFDVFDNLIDNDNIYDLNIDDIFFNANMCDNTNKFISNEKKIIITNNWFNKFNELKKYVDCGNIKLNKYLRSWLKVQKKNYDNNNNSIVNTNEIKPIWEDFMLNPKYSEYFLSNDLIWLNKLNQTKQYINDNNKKPSIYNNDRNIQQLGKWLRNQIVNYDDYNCKYFIKNNENKLLWEQFILDPKYSQYFISNENKWITKLNQVKQYIDTYNKKPLINEKNNNKSLKGWLIIQNKNYNKSINIMKNNKIKLLWENFIMDSKYSQYFISNENKWITKLNQVKQYIDIHNKKPSIANGKKLLSWITNQLANHDYNDDKCKKIMKKNNIKLLWEQFITDPKYSYYFISNNSVKN